MKKIVNPNQINLMQENVVILKKEGIMHIVIAALEFKM